MKSRLRAVRSVLSAVATKSWVFTSVAALIAAFGAWAQDDATTLICEMTDYGTSFIVPDFKQLVPPQAEHRIAGGSALMNGSIRAERVVRKGSSLEIRYSGTLKEAGAATVLYKYYRATGMMFAMTRSERTAAHFGDFGAERLQADFTVRGHCTEQ